MRDSQLRKDSAWNEALLRLPDPTALVFRHDRIAEHSDAADLDVHLVPGLHPKRRFTGETDALGCSGRDDVAGHQWRETRNIGNDRGKIENQVIRSRLLHLRAVEPS